MYGCEYKHNMSQNQMLKTSPIFKMLREVDENRKIRSFPDPYSTHLSPYGQTDFCKETKKVCDRNLSVVSTLKICKVIVIGDVCVGKTCIVNRFCHQIFDSNYKATIGVDFEVEKFDILNVPFNMQIWDTAGQERFKCIAQAYYRRAHVIIIVFDVSNISTLSHCKTWMAEALNASSFEPFKFLIGTKVDLLSEASYAVVENCASKVAKHLDAEYWPVSSKTGKNLEKLFNRIAALTFDDLIAREYEKKSVETNIASGLVSLKKNKLQPSNTKLKVGCLSCNW